MHLACQFNDSANSNTDSENDVYGDVIIATVHFIYAKRQMATNLRAKPTERATDPQHYAAFTIATYYYSAQRLIFILPSRGG